MKKGNDQSPAKAKESAVESAVEATRFDGRRQLIKAALVAAPMILTLRGRPALADLPSLGSVQVPYGPQLYVTSVDVQANPALADHLHKAIIPGKASGEFHVVQQDRRNLTPIKTFTRTAP